MLVDLIAEGARLVNLPDDIARDELTNRCLHARLRHGPSSKSALRQLTDVTLSGMRRRVIVRVP